MFFMNIKKRLTEYSPVFIPPLVLAVMFSVMIAWSWCKWPDILVDFGRELYVPWQIATGKVLYKDIAHLFGPFSSYFNALLFKLFGASYIVLVVSNIMRNAFKQ